MLAVKCPACGKIYLGFKCPFCSGAGIPDFIGSLFGSFERGEK